MRSTLLVALALTALLAGCHSDPADVAGDYTLALTNGENGCNFANWTVGSTSTNIPLSVTQDGEHITGTVGGAAGVSLDLWLGSRTYSGTVDGHHLSLTLYGSNSSQTGNCTYTINSTVTAQISGDVLQGDIAYRAATNGNPDCATIEGCVSRQSFNGTRPPQ